MRCSPATRLRWAEQTAQAISHLHSKNVFHCDISYNNIFLDTELNALVGDFAGSAIDKNESFGWYGTSHHHPDLDDPSEETEIFALGSTFYEILTGKNPFEGYLGVEAENAIRNSEFPSLDHLPALESVILKCWRHDYKTVDDLVQDLKQDGTVISYSFRVSETSLIPNTHSHNQTIYSRTTGASRLLASCWRFRSSHGSSSLVAPAIKTPAECLVSWLASSSRVRGGLTDSSGGHWGQEPRFLDEPKAT